MSVVENVNRVDPPPAASEKDMLMAYLDYHRQTLMWKCEGLPAEQLKIRAVPTSNLALLGLIRHMADVERSWFRRVIGHESRDDAPPIFYSKDDPDGDFNNLADADAAADVDTYRREVEACRQVIADGPGLDEVVERDLTVRWIMCHMLEEYARHNGHADLLREAIDGATGE